VHKREEALAEYVESLENLAFLNEAGMANFDNCTDDTFVRWFVKDQERLLASWNEALSRYRNQADFSSILTGEMMPHVLKNLDGRSKNEKIYGWAVEMGFLNEMRRQAFLKSWEGQTSCTDEFVVAFAEFIRKQAENLAAQVKDMEEKFGI